MVNFLFALIEQFSLSIAVPELGCEMCTAQLFSQGVGLFVLKFYLDRVTPIHQPFVALEN